MENAVLDFEKKLGGSRNTYGFFFYAGHGVQSNGENYLIPVAANNIRNEAQLRDRAVSLQFILDCLSDAGNELNMVVLDACRDNPFGWARSGSRGLTVVNRAPSGSIVMYATGANSTADDGSGRNGLFTSFLLENLTTPGISVFDVFDRTMASVINETRGRQHPELSLRFAGATSAYLGSLPDSLIVNAEVNTNTDTEIITDNNNNLFPFITTNINTNANTIPNVTPVSSRTVDMVLINGGTFSMGSPYSETGRSENEGPQRFITISSFYLSKYPVTQNEYLEIMDNNPSHFGGGNLPVEQVSWLDAIDYCNKRSVKEGLTPVYTISGFRINWDRNANGYRLPTEAEWEFACRAGTTSAFNNGWEANVNTGWYISNSGRKTHPVGQKPANAWGLFDMHGNVFEWCWDFIADYSGTSIDPSGPSSGHYRIQRGGSWNCPDQSLRSANRSYGRTTDKNSNTGFRIVRNVQ